jgi:RHS repeat-associated protein
MNNLLSKTDRKEQTISCGYDALYRLTSKTYPDSTAVNYNYDPLSRLTQVTDPTGAYSFTYDNLGRLLGTGTQYSFMSGTLTNSYGYDAASNRTSLTDSAGAVSSYSYDSLNRLTGLANSNSGSFGFAYDALGRRTSLTRPNGVNTSYSYDTLSRLLSVLHNGGSLPGSAGYTYDAAGNRLTKTAVQEATPSPVSVTSNYSYDPIYELTQSVVGGTLAEGYSYDPVGNRLTSAGPTSYNYNSSNQLTSTSVATYVYDNNGNTTSRRDSTGTTSYTWDFGNLLTSVTLPGTGGTVNFKYDPFGRRIEKIAPTTGTTIYAYDGDYITEELGAGGNLLAHFTQGAGIDEPLAVTGTGGNYFYHADGLGSITSLTDGSGQLAASYVYDSFGKLTASTGTVTNPFQYTAREFDSETGLYYYRARYYDPNIARFLSEDPIGLDGGINFYGFVKNTPINYTDPSGKGPEIALPLLGIGGIPVAGQVAITAGLAILTGRAIGNLPIGDGRTVDDAVTNLMTSAILASRGHSDPFPKALPFNPGREPCEKGQGPCKPCPPDSLAWVHMDGHGSTVGFHFHWIHWNQTEDCMCHPKRMDGGF